MNLWPHQNFVRWEPRGRKSCAGEPVTVTYLRNSKIRCFENMGKRLKWLLRSSPIIIAIFKLKYLKNRDLTILFQQY